MGIHLRLNRLIVLLQVLYNLLLHCPPKEVQFPHCGDELLCPWEAEHNTLATAEGVEQFLTIRLQLILITVIDHELLPLQEVANGVALGIVRHEPVNKTETDGRRTLEQLHDLRQILPGRIEVLETHHNEFLLTVDFASPCLCIGISTLNGLCLKNKWGFGTHNTMFFNHVLRPRIYEVCEYVGR